MNLSRLPILVLLFVLAAGAPAEACPMCQVAIEQQDGQTDAEGRAAKPGSQARGYFMSILARFGILGAVCFFVIRLIVIAGRQAADGRAADVPGPKRRITNGKAI